MWVSFDQWQPQRNEDVLVWCGHDRCVKHITDFRSEEASNNWLLWMPCPSPTADEIELADKQEEARIRAACGDSGSVNFYGPNGEVSRG